MSLPLSLSQDGNGWTIFTPSATSRLFYISDAGNDGTGAYYVPSEIGGDPFLPNGSMTNPFLTYAGVIATGDVRADTDDWILFQRGDTFSAQIAARSGQSDTEFALVGAYGPSGAMPIIHPVTATTIVLDWNSAFQYLAIMGLDLYSITRDPDGGAYDGVAGTSGLKMYINSGTQRQALVEGCKLRFFHINEIIVDGGAIEDIVIRRNVILDSYSNGGGFSMGLWADEVDGFTLEENIFDHNGWYDTGGPGIPSQFQHNTYFFNVHNVDYKNNIMMRASSVNTKFTADGEAGSTNITLDGNLWIDGEIGFEFGGNYSVPAMRFQNVSAVNNIITNIERDPPTERDLGWAMIFKGIDTATVADNIIMKFENPAVSFTVGVIFGQGLADLVFEDNVIYSMNSHGNADEARALYVETGETMTGMIIRNNILQEPTDEIRMVHFGASGDVSGYSFQNNIYYATLEKFDVAGIVDDFAEWVTRTSDSSSWSSHSFPDPTRDIETYMTHLGQTATIAAFIAKCRAQGRYSWDTDYTAEIVNSWIRAGFVAADEPRTDVSVVMV